METKIVLGEVILTFAFSGASSPVVARGRAMDWRRTGTRGAVLPTLVPFVGQRFG